MLTALVRGGAQASAELFDKDGFYMTGDIVQQETATRVVWIDRKKNVLKLSQGEFVSLGRLEAVYKGGSNLIHQACMALTALARLPLFNLSQSSAVRPVAAVHDSNVSALTLPCAPQVFLYGNSLRSYILAVVVPSQGAPYPPLARVRSRSTAAYEGPAKVGGESPSMPEYVWAKYGWVAQRRWRWATMRR